MVAMAREAQTTPTRKYQVLILDVLGIMMFRPDEPQKLAVTLGAQRQELQRLQINRASVDASLPLPGFQPKPTSRRNVYKLGQPPSVRPPRLGLRRQAGVPIK